MNCDIQWNTLALDEWEQRFALIKRSNFLQSYNYARAASRFYRQKARWGLILIDGQEAGLVQLMEAGFLFNAFHAVILDRGPLWFDGFGGAQHIHVFIQAFQKQFPKRFGRKRRILLEVGDGLAAQNLIKQAGLQKQENQTPFETFWLDLEQNEENLRQNLDGKWRNALKKAEKSDLTIEWDDKGAFYSWFRANYENDKSQKGYGGAAPQFLDIFAPFLLEQNNMIIGKALYGGISIAGVMLIKHGRSATYQIGFTSKEGRDKNAHHLLLWQGLSVLQRKGVKELDLGGINDQTAQGVKKFKQGMGGQLYCLVGHYS